MPHIDFESIRIELESRIAFQEKTIADLNDALVDYSRVVLDLQHRVDLLEKHMRQMNRRFESLDGNLPHEKPPHY